MIPEFDQSGNLPLGIHEATWADIVERYGYTPHRRRLLQGLELLARNLIGAGCTRLYLDGSFVSDKKSPGDYDGCWLREGVDQVKLDPLLLKEGLSAGDGWRDAMKRKYKGEVYPVTWSEVALPRSSMLDLFQTDKVTKEQKGIIELDLRGLSL
jgi:hypothetical protein